MSQHGMHFYIFPGTLSLACEDLNHKLIQLVFHRYYRDMGENNGRDNSLIAKYDSTYLLDLSLATVNQIIDCMAKLNIKRLLNET